MILQKNNLVLRTAAKAVEKIKSDETKLLIKNMAAALLKEPDGIGIAAPQIGISLKIFLVTADVLAPETLKERAGGTEPGILVFINPTIKKRSTKKNVDIEGCLSVRGDYGEVTRPEKITIEYFDENGKKISRGASGLLARVIQHEMDHLDGVLFVDKAKNIKHISDHMKHET